MEIKKIIVYYSDNEKKDICGGEIIFTNGANKQLNEKMTYDYLDVLAERLGVKWQRLLDDNPQDERIKNCVEKRVYSTRNFKKKTSGPVKPGIVKNINIYWKKVKKVIKVGVAIVLVGGGLWKGYKYISPDKESDIMSYHNNFLTFMDLNMPKDAKEVLRDMDWMERIFARLANGGDVKLSKGDIERLYKDFRKIGSINNDNDVDELGDFFNLTMADKLANGMDEKEVLNKLQNLYNAIQEHQGGKRYEYSPDNAKKFLAYAISLVEGGINIYDSSNPLLKYHVAVDRESGIYARMNPVVKVWVNSLIQGVLEKHPDINFKNVAYGPFYNKGIDSRDFYAQEYLEILNNRIKELGEEASQKKR